MTNRHQLGKQKAKLRKGLLGEQILGKFLEEQLMPHKYQVIHDLVCKNGERTFNIDHVVIGPTGVFSIETKYWKKPAGPGHQIFDDGKKILVDGKVPDSDPFEPNHTKKSLNQPDRPLSGSSAMLFVREGGI